MDSYLMKHENETEPVGTLHIDIAEDIFDFKLNENYKGELPHFVSDPGTALSKNELVKMWVLERAPEPNYEWIDALIQKIGCTHYDPYAFFKYNEGRFITDRFYAEKI
jgi:hypothetical protein